MTSIESLFFDKWKYLKNNYKKKTIIEKGSFHRSRDIENYINFLHNGWDTKVKNIIGIANNMIKIDNRKIGKNLSLLL